MIVPSRLRIVGLLVLLVASALCVAAQAGRRTTSKSPVPASSPAVSSEPEGRSKSEIIRHLQLLVAVYEPSGFDRVPLSAPDTVLETCVLRLRESNQLMAVAAPRRMTRSEAIKAAKAETDRYLVWLEVRSERANSGADVSTHSNQLYVNYTILEPITAKIKQSGRAQYRTAKVGNVGVSGPLPRAVYSDYAIKETARQAADKILAAFEVRVGGWPR